MRRFSEWLWRRCRARYSLTLAVMTLGLAWVGVNPLVLAAGWAWFDIPGRNLLPLLALANPLMIVGVAVGFGMGAEHRRAVDAWGRGDQIDPLHAVNPFPRSGR